MVKTNIPVIILRGNILLPFSELRLSSLDFQYNEILNNALKNNDGHVLFVTTDNIDVSLNKKELPNIGVIGKIKMQLQISEEETRFIIEGVTRVDIIDYHENIDGIEDAVITKIKKEPLDTKEEFALVRILKKEVELQIKELHTISNNVLEQISSVNSLAKVTDLIVPHLNISFERKLKYLMEPNPTYRVKMILSDLEEEREYAIIEEELEEKLKYNLDEQHKEYILKEKLKIIKEELNEDYSLKDKEVAELNEKLENSIMPENFKKILRREIDRFESLVQTSPEISIVRDYIDTIFRIPFGIITEDNDSIEEIQESLNNSHYGLESLKLRFIEQLAVNANNKSADTPVICLVGPPGVGKTTFVQNIAKALNRKFAKITVAGAVDEAELIGHRRAYIGATPGRIVKGLIKSESMNPVFLVDEIDKIGKDFKGDPSNIFLEVFDKNQNKTFSDNYIEEEIDLSKVMFISTANNIYDIPHALRDRLEIIELKQYTTFEKIEIAKSHLIPDICNNFNIKLSQVKINDKTIKYIIDSYTSEAGVRDLTRMLTTILRKIVYDMQITNGAKKVYKVTVSNVSDYLGKPKYIKEITTNKCGVVNALAYSPYGGSEVTKLEVVKHFGNGNIEFTGNIGKITDESSKIVFTYLKSMYEEFKLSKELFTDFSYHIHMLDASSKKDGPSAGITLATSILSSMLKITIDSKIAMTGEISLTGDILPIGGVKEKLIAAYDSGITTIFLPKLNESALEEIPNVILDKLTINLVSDYKEVYDLLFL